MGDDVSRRSWLKHGARVRMQACPRRTSFGFAAQELASIQEIIRRGRWFFLKVSGRSGLLYLQIPDTDPARAR